MVWQKMTPKQREEWNKIPDTTQPSAKLAKLARQVAKNSPAKGFKDNK